MNLPENRSPALRFGESGEPMSCRFDEYSERYEDVLNRGLSVSGENSRYFARGRIARLARLLELLQERPRELLDYGCGNGAATELFFEMLPIESLLGVDSSPGLLDAARKAHGSDRARFALRGEVAPAGRLDLAFCNGVFHHVPPAKRATEVEYLYDCLRPGGLLALFENNPWNPGTRYVMSRISFDDDAVTLTPPEACRVVRRQGFEVLRREFLFVFPRFFKGLRFLEPALSTLPFGAQYLIVCRKRERGEGPSSRRR